MTTKLRTLLACCAMTALAVPLAACDSSGSDDAPATQAFLAQGLEPGWSMTDLAGVDPQYLDESGALPDAVPMQASYDGDYAYAPAYDYAPDDDAYYEPLDDGYYYTGDDYYDDDWYDDGYDDDGYYDDAYYDGRYDLDGDASDYALLALAVSLASMLGDAPPDYAFGYGGISPWAWQTGDRYFRYAEPIRGGYRYYYYEPGAARPFFVADPYYSYGYRGDRLVVIYDRDGRRIDAARADLQRRAAQDYYSRAEQLYRAAQHDRYGVPAPLWAKQRDALARDRSAWVGQQSRRPAWQQWEARNEPRLQRQWGSEALVRRSAENSFTNWQRADYRTPPPKFYTKDVQATQVRQVAELRRDKPDEIAERRRERAEVRVANQQEMRKRIAERAPAGEPRRDGQQVAKDRAVRPDTPGAARQDNNPATVRRADQRDEQDRRGGPNMTRQQPQRQEAAQPRTAERQQPVRREQPQQTAPKRVEQPAKAPQQQIRREPSQPAAQRERPQQTAPKRTQPDKTPKQEQQVRREPAERVSGRSLPQVGAARQQAERPAQQTQRATPRTERPAQQAQRSTPRTERTTPQAQAATPRKEPQAGPQQQARQQQQAARQAARQDKKKKDDDDKDERGN